MAAEDGGSSIGDTVTSIGAFLLAMIAFVVKWGALILVLLVVYLVYRAISSARKDEVDVSKMSKEEILKLIKDLEGGK